MMRPAFRIVLGTPCFVLLLFTASAAWADDVESLRLDYGESVSTWLSDDARPPEPATIHLSDFQEQPAPTRSQAIPSDRAATPEPEESATEPVPTRRRRRRRRPRGPSGRRRGRGRKLRSAWLRLLSRNAPRSAPSGRPPEDPHRSGIGTVPVGRLPRLHRACPSTARDKRFVSGGP